MEAPLLLATPLGAGEKPLVDVGDDPSNALRLEILPRDARKVSTPPAVGDVGGEWCAVGS